MIACEARLPVSAFPHDPDCVRIFFGRVHDGYGWAFPKEGHVNAGVMTRTRKGGLPRTILARFLREDLGLRDQGSLGVEAGLIPRWSAKGGLAFDRVLLVGDSGGIADPFLAEGISYAVLSGSLAAPVIASAHERGDGNLRLYEEAVRTIFSDHFRSAERLSRCTKYFPGLSFLIIKKRQEAAVELFDLVRGNTTYTEFTRRLRRTVLGLR